MLYEVAYYSDFIYINVYSSNLSSRKSCVTIWVLLNQSLFHCCPVKIF